MLAVVVGRLDGAAPAGPAARDRHTCWSAAALSFGDGPGAMAMPNARSAAMKRLQRWWRVILARASIFAAV